MSDHAPHSSPHPPAASNFLRQIIERDLAQGRYHGRLWGGSPGDGSHHERGVADPARVRMRFPPEPNGYLHVGHAKSIWLNFSLAQAYGGVCHMRFDDTNPEKEEQEYVDSILDAVQWLGWSWEAHGTRHLYYASDYFDFMYRAAEYLIETGHAYVDEQTPEQMRANRGTLTEPGIDSPYRNRPAEESLARFREMRDGRHADGAMVLRAKIDMASPNINLRDPAIYRIKHATHHNTGDAWCIYPMYTFAHPIEDALENITHSICTLEFEDQRPFYDWLLERIVPILRAPQFERARQLVERIEQQGVEAGKEFALHCHNHAHKLGLNTEPEQRMRALFTKWEHDRDAVLRDLGEFFGLLKTQTHQFTPLLASALETHRIEPFNLPHQYEFARLNLTYVVTSKRKLKQLVDEGIVSGWDDPRMPTIVGLRRRGYTPEAIRLFCERTGVSKAGGWIDYSNLEIALRDDLEGKAPRAMAVLDPVKLKLTNWAQVFGDADHREACSAPVHPQRPELGLRAFSLGPEVWIEREDFMEQPPKGYFRLFPGNKVRLKYGYVVECTGCEKDADGRVTAVLATVVPDTKSGTPGADAVKVKGTLTWVGVHEAVPAEVRLYDRLFADPQPDAGGKDFKAALNPNSLRVVTAYLEPSLANAPREERYQFERHGYFGTDRVDHTPERPVFNRIAGLKDSWGK
ncbi:Glutamine--tRNA ligase [Tepidimonas fonticaldi]|uniref:Glutamine--tRNA ligase n=1 Tax=Tepidimonas fonticaldi TaxID=1101373 RepID=A0A554XNC9_9BURK|nr:glutamine--tRNA ligase [Tepidimonas fonticaldi]TSE37328.1 Glutamine--tRNA ligase [Tepidimonas fonticaldi]